MCCWRLGQPVRCVNSRGALTGREGMPAHGACGGRGVGLKRRPRPASEVVILLILI